MKIKLKELTINNELLHLIPRPDSTSRDLLKQAIIDEGIREPLLTAYLDGKLTLIDGYTRYTIAAELGHDEIEVNVEDRLNEDIEAIKEQMLIIQLSRRNFTKLQYNDFIGKLYNLRKDARGGDRRSQEFSKGQNVLLKNQEMADYEKMMAERYNSLPDYVQVHMKPKGQNVPLVSTAESIAEQFGLNEKSVKRAGKLSESIDRITESGLIDRNTILNKGVSQKEIVDLGNKLSEAETAEAREELIKQSLFDEYQAKQAEKIRLEDLSPEDLEVIRTLKRDGIAVAKMNHWRVGKSQLQKYCEQEGFFLQVDRKHKTLGNPYEMNQEPDNKSAGEKRASVINKFKIHLYANAEVISEALPETKGKVLFCHCYPKPCHADVIKQAALGQFDLANLHSQVMKIAEEN